MAEKNYPIKVFYSIFFTLPQLADAAFVWYRSARMRGRPIKPHPSAQRAPRCGANDCADERFVVQPSTFHPETALGSGFSLQAAFWYQNAMLALFLCSKKSPKCSPILIPLRRIFCFSFCTSHEIQNFCASDAVLAARAPAMGNSADRAWPLSQPVTGVFTAFNPSAWQSVLCADQTLCVQADRTA